MVQGCEIESAAQCKGSGSVNFFFYGLIAANVRLKLPSVKIDGCHLKFHFTINKTLHFIQNNI